MHRETNGVMNGGMAARICAVVGVGGGILTKGFEPEFWAVTDIGARRDKNEDAFLWLGPEQTHERGWLWLVCDGMGGASAGELASATVCEVVAEIYPAALASSGNPHEALRAAFEAANRRLVFMQKENPALHRMGTTAVALAFYEERVWVASVGDSRVYVHSGEKLRQVTTDQTQLQTMLQAGVIRPEDSLNHPAGHILVSALGRSTYEVDTLGDRSFDPTDSSFLVCTDGLSSFVSVSRMDRALRMLSAFDASHALVELARDQSTDNITAVVVHFGTPRGEGGLSAFLAHEAPQTLALVQGVERPTGHPPTVSFSFRPKETWERFQTGANALVAAPLPVPKAPSASSTEAREASSANGGTLPLKRGIAIDRRSSDAALADDRARSTRESAPTDSSRSRWLAVGVALAAASLVFLIVGVIKWRSSPADVEPADEIVALPELPAPEAPTPHNEPLEGHGPIRFERAELGEFAAAPKARVPDRIHVKDGMPAYRVAGGRLLIDAHEVTVEQFRNVLARSAELAELHREIDVARYAALPCSTGSLERANDPREPVCVSPESASVYCREVGRRLPSRGDWRALEEADKLLIGHGYGRMFRYGSDGPPPPIPETITGILGVWDGLPESLDATALDLARGDVATLGASPGAADPIIVDARLSARFIGEDMAPNARPMLGFRCAVDDEKPRRLTPVAEQSVPDSPRNRIMPVRVRMEGSSSTPSTAPSTAEDSRLLERYRRSSQDDGR